MVATTEITLAAACELLPKRRGKQVHPKTVLRWVNRGCGGVRLSAWKRGAIWYTSAEELEHFRIRCSQRSSAVLERSPAQIAKEVSEARRKLTEKGFYGKDGRQLKPCRTRTVPNV